MWKIYTASAIRHNRSTSITAIIAVLIASTFLSLICGFAYNTWTDAMRRAGGVAIESEPVAPFVALGLVVCLSVIWILSSAFSVSMQSRIRHMGILSSVGATPRQQRTALVQEAIVLSLPAVFVGTAVGIGLTWGIIQYSNAIARQVQTDKVLFDYSWLVFLFTIGFCLFSVWVSAMWCARKLAQLSPLEAIRGGNERQVKKMRKFRLTAALFGVEGMLARKSLFARRKAFRTTVLSLTLSVLVFITFLNMMTLSDISTEQTYFERYKDTWDLRVTSETAREFELLSEIREIPGVLSCIASQSVGTYAFLSENMLSDALVSLGGPEALRDTGIVATDGGYWVQAPLIILDEGSFQAYCAEWGITIPQGSVIAINRIWDNLHSHYREPAYVDFLGQIPENTVPLYARIQGAEVATVSISVYATQFPQIREAHRNFSLTMVMDISTYETIEPNLPREVTSYTIRAISDAEIMGVEVSLREMVAGSSYVIENRLTEAEYNVSARQALYQIVGVLCGLLALIGLANVFSNTLGGAYQRQREFARYISVGLSPRGVKKVIMYEGIVVGLQPVLLTLPVTLVLLTLFLNASHLSWTAFLPRMPVIPVLVFIALLWTTIAVAYVLGYRALMGSYAIVEILKNDTTY